MPEHSRGVDYLYLHANVSQRVSNLETGVHPTRSEYGDTDSLGPTQVTITGPFLNFGTVTYKLSWTRKIGIVQLAGAVECGLSHTISEMAASEVICTLPPDARPPYGLRLQGRVDFAPYFFSYTVDADGKLTVFKPDGIDPTKRVHFFFEGSSWGHS